MVWFLIGELTYFKSDPGNDCAKGLRSIDNLLECEYLAEHLKKSLELIKSSDFLGPYRPKGCYLLKDKEVYFNEHAIGYNEYQYGSKFCKLGTQKIVIFHYHKY